ncbi:hypothetical protein LTR94_028136, partial [Friedmanniomyces endolithicus]
GTTFENVVLRPSGDVQSLTAVGGLRPEQWQSAAFGQTDTYQFAVGGKYTAGPAEWTFDVARTDSTFTNSIHNIDTAFTSSPVADVNFDVPREDGGVEFSFRDFDVTDPDNYIYRGLFDRRFEGKGDDVQARIDVKFDTGIGLLPETRFGVRYVDRNASYENGERYLNQEDLGIPLAELPVELGLVQPGFNGSDVQQMRSWVAPTYDSIRDNPDIDIVYICLPVFMHAEYTIRAAQAGKHVMCEKPMAVSVAECEQMIAACRKAGKKLMLGYRSRFEPHNVEAIRQARSGAIGKLRYFRSEHGFVA